MKNVAVIAPGEADCLALSALHGASFAQRWSADAIRALLETSGTFAAAARAGSELAGFVMARVAADEAEILTLAVPAKWHRRGFGRALVETAAHHAETLGARVLFLEVDTTNAPARALYEALGFEAVGARKGYYRDLPGQTASDALTLRASLPLKPVGKRKEVL